MAGILRLSEAFALAFHAMAALADAGEEPVSVSEMASMGVSEAHLAKVLQRLARMGLLSSRRGPKGGFALAKPAEQITLLEVLHAVEGPLASDTCLLERKICPPGECRMEYLMRSIHDQVYEYLANTKLSDVALPLVHRKGKEER